MIDDNPLEMIGSMIANLIWTLLVSIMVFALAGCSGGGGAPEGVRDQSRPLAEQ